jgi:hypothetical protein
MSAQVLLALGMMLVVLLLIVVARARTGRAGDREVARGLIGKEIDAHIEALAESYLEAHAERGVRRPGTDPFGQAIELFIGDVLCRRAERAEPYLRKAPREVLVLQRGDLYGEIRARVEAHPHRPSPAGPARPPRARIRT